MLAFEIRAQQQRVRCCPLSFLYTQASHPPESAEGIFQCHPINYSKSHTTQNLMSAKHDTLQTGCSHKVAVGDLAK